MNNKVLVKIIEPIMNESFDMYIPVNEYIWVVKKLIAKNLSGLLPAYSDNVKTVLINMDTSRIYTNNEIIIDTDIRNGTKIIIIVEKKIVKLPNKVNINRLKSILRPNV